jgi:hypothetical protein
MLKEVPLAWVYRKIANMQGIYRFWSFHSLIIRYAAMSCVQEFLFVCNTQIFKFLMLHFQRIIFGHTRHYTLRLWEVRAMMRESTYCDDKKYGVSTLGSAKSPKVLQKQLNHPQN